MTGRRNGPAGGTTDPEVAAACLAGLPGLGASRLARLLADDEPCGAWRRVLAGRVGATVAPAGVRHGWTRAARSVDPAAVARRLATAGITVTTPHDPRHPPGFSTPEGPAPVVFWRGRIGRGDRPHVVVVGTRRCTPTGREFAAELGAGLAAAGVVVVSGLALGIDGAAHRGALAAGGVPPVAVVGSGVDVVYPRRHVDLWESVAARGSLLSEAPPGSAPEAWRFPARNRLLAALADLVVVVESRTAGGSMHTVEQALRRGVEVMAVPGSVRNPAAAGTNRLLAEGCAPVCDVDDVLVALGLSGRHPRPAGTSGSEPVPTVVSRAADTGADGPDAGRLVLDALGDAPCSLDRLAVLTGLAPALVAATVEGLVASGRVILDGARFVADPGRPAVEGP